MACSNGFQIFAPIFLYLSQNDRQTLIDQLFENYENEINPQRMKESLKGIYLILENDELEELHIEPQIENLMNDTENR
ncbi:MAG: hypothetical protein HWD61_12605 [Parachlamydiaceae bacterium]|nr:MAG: hypothetical protein HWD61_12605 [Parachlamydiaceae bacterium]